MVILTSEYSNEAIIMVQKNTSYITAIIPKIILLTQKKSRIYIYIYTYIHKKIYIHKKYVTKIRWIYTIQISKREKKIPHLNGLENN